MTVGKGLIMILIISKTFWSIWIQLDNKFMSGYVMDPLKFSFDKVVKITAIMFKFIKSFKCMKNKLNTTKESTNKF